MSMIELLMDSWIRIGFMVVLLIMLFMFWASSRR